MSIDDYYEFIPSVYNEISTLAFEILRFNHDNRNETFNVRLFPN